jgi:hypothetical protein
MKLKKRFTKAFEKSVPCCALFGRTPAQNGPHGAPKGIRASPEGPKGTPKPPPGPPKTRIKVCLSVTWKPRMVPTGPMDPFGSIFGRSGGLGDPKTSILEGLWWLGKPSKCCQKRPWVPCLAPVLSLPSCPACFVCAACEPCLPRWPPSVFQVFSKYSPGARRTKIS